MAIPIVIPSLSAVKDYVGKPLGPSDWLTITQERIDRFAEATGDRQWIHVDVERAQRESPFKQTIAHGYLTLSLLPVLLGQIVEVKRYTIALNTGIEKMRLPAPVPVGSRVRLRSQITAVRKLPRGGLRTTFACVFEVEGQSKPACLADAVIVLRP